MYSIKCKDCLTVTVVSSVPFIIRVFHSSIESQTSHIYKKITTRDLLHTVSRFDYSSRCSDVDVNSRELHDVILRCVYKKSSTREDKETPPPGVGLISCRNLPALSLWYLRNCLFFWVPLSEHERRLGLGLVVDGR